MKKLFSTVLIFAFSLSYSQQKTLIQSKKRSTEIFIINAGIGFS